MDHLTVISHPQPLAQPQSIEPTTRPPTGKVRKAIEAMVWDGLPRRHAAEQAGISEHGLYKALRKPPVKAFYMRELEVLRTSERARNIQRLIDIRDAANNMPAVNAIKMLEQLDESQQASNIARSSVPGFVIVLQPTMTAAPANTQQAKPLIEHDEVRSHSTLSEDGNTSG